MRTRIRRLWRRAAPPAKVPGRSGASLASNSSIESNFLIDSETLRKLDRLSLRLGVDLLRGLMGEHRALRRTTGIEFADHREYSPGDDLRRVDWNAYARLGTLHVRQAQAEHETALYMLLDASPSMDYGEANKFLLARRLAAGIGYIALAHLDTLVLEVAGGMSVDGAQRSPGATQPAITIRGRAMSGDLFRRLQELKTGHAIPFDDVLVRPATSMHMTVAGAAPGAGSTRAVQSDGGIAVIISDLLLDGYRDGVRRLVGAGFQVTLLHVLCSEELDPGHAGNLEVIDSETGERLEVSLGRESLAEYRRRLNKWLTETEAWCRSEGVGYMLVQSNWDIERVLVTGLRRQGLTT